MADPRADGPLFPLRKLLGPCWREPPLKLVIQVDPGKATSGRSLLGVRLPTESNLPPQLWALEPDDRDDRQ